MAVNYANDVPMVGQANTKCCWLACYQMIYAWKHSNQDTSTPVTKIKNAGLSTTSALEPGKFCTARNAIGLTSYSASFLKKSADNLMWVLEKHGPVWSAGFFLGGSAHAILLVGMSDSGWLTCYDPYEVYSYHGTSSWTYENWVKLAFDQTCSHQMYF